MEWLNLHVSTLDSADFRTAEPVDQATWLLLLRYLCGQENGDFIRDCKKWTDRHWSQICGVSLEQVNRPSTLFEWRENDLWVNFYPHAAEKKTKAQRRGAINTNRKRWQNHASPQTSDTPSESLTDSLPPQTASHLASRKRNVTEHKETEHNPPRARGGGVDSGIPSDDEVFEFARSFPGEAASGMPPIPPAYVDEWLAKMAGRTIGWPMDWKRSLVADWRKDFRTWQPGGKKNAAKKNGAARERWQVEKDLQSVREQIESHPRRTWPAGKPLPPEVKKAFDALVSKRKDLEQELGGAA